MNTIAHPTEKVPQDVPALAYKIAVLVFVQNSSGEHLLLLLSLIHI